MKLKEANFGGLLYEFALAWSILDKGNSNL